jgi:hypothetical protein
VEFTASFAIVTVRIIKSFAYRTIKNHVFKDLDLTTTTVAGLLELVNKGGCCASSLNFVVLIERPVIQQS